MQRGAEVNYAEVYSRKIATADPAPLIANWEREVDIVTATSCGILENLFSLLGEKGRNLLRTTPLAVVSERIMVRAQEFGCEKVILANEASDQGLLLAICDWANDTSR
jgi:uroporphyrinogen-III synthase